MRKHRFEEPQLDTNRMEHSREADEDMRHLWQLASQRATETMLPENYRERTP
jgi:hypothetical protein